MGRRGPQPAHPAIQKARKTAPSRRQPASACVSVAEAREGLLPIEPPDHLEGSAAECWERITRLQHALVKAGRQPYVAEPERQLLEVACFNYGQWRLATEIFTERVRRLRERIKETGAAPSNLAAAMLEMKGGDEGAATVVGGYQKAVERTSDAMLRSFRALGLPKAMPTLIAQLEAETASGDRVAARLLAA